MQFLVSLSVLNAGYVHSVLCPFHFGSARYKICTDWAFVHTLMVIKTNFRTVGSAPGANPVLDP